MKVGSIRLCMRTCTIYAPLCIRYCTSDAKLGIHFMSYTIKATAATSLLSFSYNIISTRMVHVCVILPRAGSIVSNSICRLLRRFLSSLISQVVSLLIVAVSAATIGIINNNDVFMDLYYDSAFNYNWRWGC